MHCGGHSFSQIMQAVATQSRHGIDAIIDKKRNRGRISTGGNFSSGYCTVISRSGSV